jgi:uncharacterized protein (TIGR02452 family)
MANRSQRAVVASETVAILQRGGYELPGGECVEIGPQLKEAVAGSVHYGPADFRRVFAELDEQVAARRSAGHAASPAFEVVNCTTLAAARRLVEADPAVDPLCLNFASAKNPGGGFLGGSQAQEESLARASGLYACQQRFPEMYDANRACRTCLYLDHMIYSPRVPVFRDDEDRLLSRTYAVSFLTAPAVNRGAVEQNERENLPRVEATMLERIEKLLAVAVVQGHDTLVLGAWGCGVFRNDPSDVAAWFHRQLIDNPAFQGAFRRVVFAVLDRDERLGAYQAFARQFGSAAS